jgi:hypothetical protein
LQGLARIISADWCQNKSRPPTLIFFPCPFLESDIVGEEDRMLDLTMNFQIAPLICVFLPGSWRSIHNAMSATILVKLFV